MTAAHALQSARTMRLLLVSLLVVACSEPTYVPRPLPPLVAPTIASEMTELTPSGPGFLAGERLVWEVWLRGMSLGRIVLTATHDEVQSHFATTGLASAVASVSHDLVTSVRDGRPVTATERLAL